MAHPIPSKTLARILVWTLLGIVIVGVMVFVFVRADTGSRSAATTRQWISANAITLSTSEAGHGFDDLAPIKAMVGSAHIVALGEATHGTRETFQMKHRLVEFLVSECGFTLFAIEANMPEAQDLNAYVRGAQPPSGGVDALLAGMNFWTWETEEVRSMVDWMREYNADPVNRAAGRGVGFTGFDMQRPDYAAQQVYRYVETRRPELAPLVQGALETLRRIRPGDPIAEWEQVRSSLASSANADSEAGAWAVQDARVVVQALSDRAGRVERDRSMAENVTWLRQQYPGDRIILWAHNAHIADDAYLAGSYHSMGTHLRESYGVDYVALGFAIGHGSYRARVSTGGPLGDFLLEDPFPGSVEQLLDQTGLGLALIDLRPARSESSQGHALYGSMFQRSIGALKVTGQFQSTMVARSFDLLLWQRDTTAARPLPDRVAGSPADLRTKGDLDGAVAALRQQAETNPTQVNYQELGATELMRGNPGGATAAFEKIIQLWPGRPAGYFLRGAVRQAAGDSEGALADFDSTLKTTGNTALAFTAEIYRALELQQVPGAQRTDTFVRSLPNGASDWQPQMGRYVLGQLPEIDFLKRARIEDPGVQPGQQLPQAYYVIGLKHLTDGDADKARAAFEQAISEQTNPLASGLAQIVLKRLPAAGTFTIP